MACGIALKRPLEIDQYMSPEGAIKRPRTTSAHFSPLRPAFVNTTPSVAGTSPSSSRSPNSIGTASHPSPFQSISSRLSTEQLESYLRAEIRNLRRRRLLPRRRDATGTSSVPASASTASYRAGPASPCNSSDSEGEHHGDTTFAEQDSASSSRTSTERPQFTFKQVQMICERLLKEQEVRLRQDYESTLNAKLAEQYDTFVKFTHDQIHRQLDTCSASYVS